MVQNFGSKPEDIRAAIGPNVGLCHFETDADVPEAMLAAFGEEVSAYIQKKGEKYYLDLKAINALALRRAGVQHIEISDDCTMCQPDRFWSHRVTRATGEARVPSSSAGRAANEENHRTDFEPCYAGRLLHRLRQ